MSLVQWVNMPPYVKCPVFTLWIECTKTVCCCFSQIRFEHRFMPFQAIDTPQLVVYDQYREVTNASKQNAYKNSDLFLMSANYFQQARTILEIASYSVEEVPSLLKVAKTNLVVMKLAAGGHKKDSQSPPTFDFSHHSHFPIIQLN